MDLLFKIIMSQFRLARTLSEKNCPIFFIEQRQNITRQFHLGFSLFCNFARFLLFLFPFCLWASVYFFVYI